ncbi:MAG: trypsin-like peptidase domain-containing protein [Limisphaerales bacterium]
MLALFPLRSTTAQPSALHPPGSQPSLYRPGIITLLPDEPIETTQLQADEGKTAAQARLALRYSIGAGVPMDAAKAAEWFRKAAEQGDANALVSIGFCYMTGKGVPRDIAQAIGWFVKAARQGNAIAEYDLAWCHENGVVFPQDHQEAFLMFSQAARQGDAAAQYSVGFNCMEGNGTAKDEMEGARWYRKAAEQGYDAAQLNLGNCYQMGKGVEQNLTEAVKWFHRSALQGDPAGQFNLAMFYLNGAAVAKDYVIAYQWFNLAAAQGLAEAKAHVAELEQHMTPEQIADGQRLATTFVPQLEMPVNGDAARPPSGHGLLQGMASGFFITPDGYFVTAEHVVRGANRIELVTKSGKVSAAVVKVDPVDDLALLKTEGRFAALPVASSREMRLGGAVATIGFPNVPLQGFAPKLAKGEIAAISGFRDDPRYFQISVPVQPGNSGGALVDNRGNVVGVVCAKLNAAIAILATGAVPENVNYAVKSTFLLGFLESAPEVAGKLKKENSRARRLDDVIQAAEEASALVNVY